MSISVAIIVARSKNGVIGRDGGLPWRLSEDLKFFKKTTMGKPVIMGRKTFESIGKPLKGRANIIVTRNEDYEFEDIPCVPTLEFALEAATLAASIAGIEEIMIIGGGEIYGQVLEKTETIYLTEVDVEVDGDVSFTFDEADWNEVDRSDPQTDAKSGVAFCWRKLQRK